MIQWTDNARQTFDLYCERARQSLEGSGADAVEVIDDLQRHVDEEIRSAQLTFVTEEDIQRILARVGEPAAGSKSKQETTPLSKPIEQPQGRRWPGRLFRSALFGFGVILPAITIVFELVTGMSAGVLFDPMPTWFHVLILASVPVLNLWIWFATRNGNAKHSTLLGWLNGAAIGVCVYYALLYLPFSPIAAIGVIWFGLGLIPLGPYFALICALFLRRSYRSRIGAEKLPGLWRGLAVAFVVLLALQLPGAITYYGLAKAGSDDPATSNSAVRLLRAYGDRELMLRASYGMLTRELNMDVVREIASGGHRISAEEARTAYYRATGQPFNSTPAPPIYGRAGRWNLMEEEFTWDDALGGETVAGQVKGLSLQGSRLDAVVEPEAAVVYCEWTLEFRNVSPRQREARAQIALPPDGVVSRLTLWVNGEEREAAFAGRSQVREAYQKVAVVQRRDPVLVTTCGPDRVLVQCFPIPPNGGTMKVRLGITVPLALDSLDRGRFRWPGFLERNFGIGQELKHALWIESPSQLTTQNAALKSEHPEGKNFALHGTLSEKDFAATGGAVVVNRPADVLSVWTPALEANQIVRQTIRETAPTAISRMVLVIDGSAGMDEYAKQISDALAKLPKAAEVCVLLAGDETIELDEKPQKATADFIETIQKRLRSFRFAGGRDNLPALERACEIASESGNGTVVWIHSPQPVQLSSADALRQRLERSASSVRVIGLQTHPGPNRIAEKLDGLAGVRFAPRFGTVKSDLAEQLAILEGAARRFDFAREQLPQQTDAAAGRRASRHIERLWARDEAMKLFSERKRDEAAKLAARNQLVTPVSGAVVLETAQQYAENNLKPADPTSVPAIPEPQTWALLAVGVILLLWRKFTFWRRGLKWAAAGARNFKS